MKDWTWWIALLPLTLVGCADTGEDMTEPLASPAAEASATPNDEPVDRLSQVLAAQSEDMQARYAWRHPEETLRLFRIEPGQTVVEALPGGGWYSKILLPYLGSDGTLVGATYEDSLWPLFGFFDEEAIAERMQFPTQWPDQVAGWSIDGAASVEAYTLGTMPDHLTGTVDRVLFVRALHNLARFEGDGDYMTRAIEESLRVLKPGGLVGVVQHRAPNDAPDEWATGAAGYLKEADVKRAFISAGFELMTESGINRNRADQPTPDDIVWRLPPSLSTSQEDPELRASLEAIGESDRMTVVFRKPEA
ncbi:MAG: methyltransferase [Pseudomonadota bacterium]